ncbi:uncharacterized protein A1O9_04634 [Exophiala aquamarina CBS 119918]|uniref:Carboxylic ester hydrolase n=1 Tax=Exophiala aquamarina CBS 119918 TaxID=1182545 RepID=A0A072PIX0_9EURO|nr:uncharacterized protein A1O9_04634 [Exophiala aquamarina CBS 119918]KEF59786.1 hypothetical protein A1O9_04634 [Exophiala aquamarina CBS 119918]
MAQANNEAGLTSPLDYRRTKIIKTTHGPVQGILEDGMQKFVGIPYALPPVGDLRWKPPVSPLLWEEPLEVVEFGPICAQTSICFPGFGSTSSTEDCLYLNVFKPENHEPHHQSKAPVMVFIHGGGYSCGASNDYNPESLVKDGQVVFVSLNYRVSMFGFFSHPEINREGHPSGNYGIMDQQLALKWVRENIERFGGNKENITVFGESAGGGSILAHIAAPSSRGLFHKAIIESGGAPPTMPFPSVEKLESLGVALTKAAGCTEQTPKSLRSIPVEALLEADKIDEGQFGIGKFPFGLMEDGMIVVRDLRDKFSRGEFNRIPMIIGVNRDEFTWFQAMSELRSGKAISAEEYPETLSATIDLLNRLHLNGVIVPQSAIPQVLEKYPAQEYESASRALAAVVGDAGLISTAGRRATRILARYCPQVFAYEFDVPDTPCPWPEVSFSYGSAHTLELPYIFPGFCGASGKASPLSKPQQALAMQMVRYWTMFARYGTPNKVSNKEDGIAQAAPKWNAYDAEEDNIMLLQAAEPSEMIKGWGERHNSDFWDAFY